MFKLKVVKFHARMTDLTKTDVVFYNKNDIDKDECYLRIKKCVYKARYSIRVPKGCIMLNKIQRFNSMCLTGREIFISFFNIDSGCLPIKECYLKVRFKAPRLHKNSEIKIDDELFDKEIKSVLLNHVLTLDQEIFLEHQGQVLVATVTSDNSFTRAIVVQESKFYVTRVWVGHTEMVDSPRVTSKIHIGFAGILAAGKTTTATLLAKRLGMQILYEEVEENPYLSKFYGNMKKYAFPLQVYLLNRRFRQHLEVVWTKNRCGVQDRTIYEDKIFARMLNEMGFIDDLDYKTYLELFDNMSNFMRKPDVIIYLKIKPETSKRRLDKRARECESSVTLEYLTDLSSRYDKFIEEIGVTTPVLEILSEDFEDVDGVVDEIIKQMKCKKLIKTLM